VIQLPDDTLVIGLGGNTGDEAAVIERFHRAREALAVLGDVRSAPLYRTAPQPAGNYRVNVHSVIPDFLNSALRVRYPDATPGELIATVLELERMLGRDRRGEPRNGPRAIDLDVLVWGKRALRTPELEVPHPRIGERRFALQPLADLVGEDYVLAGSPLGVWLARVADQACEQIAASW